MRIVSIRRSLLWNLVILVVILGAAIMGSMTLFSRIIVRELSSMLIRQALDHATVELSGFFNPVQAQLLQAKAWTQAGLLDPDDPQALRRLMTPVMREHAQISSVIIADNRGHEVFLLRAGDTWRLRQTRRDEWGERVTWQEWKDGGGDAVESVATTDYDPRQRSWYRGAVQQRDELDASRHGIFWTDPYIFFTTKTPGMTAAVAFDTPEHAEVVVGFDVLLSDISAFTRHLRVTPNGMVAVMTHQVDETTGETKLRVIGLPADPRFEDPAAQRDSLLKTPDELGTPLARDASRAFEKHARQPVESVRFRSARRNWWGQWRFMQLPPSRVLVISVVVPEADLLQHLFWMRVMIPGLLVAALAIAVLRALYLSRMYSAPIELLVEDSHRISRGDLEPGTPIDSPVKEVRQLARAHEHMREELRSLVKLEQDIELAKQIQQRTFPTVFPGLKGFELEAFTRPAAKTGGDSYDLIGWRIDSTSMTQLVSEDAQHVTLMLADATGHGFGPALAVSQVRAMLRMAVRVSASLTDIATHMNEQLHADMPPGRFVTTWLGQLDAAERKLISLSAGQAPLLHFVAAERTCRVMAADTLPMGIVEPLPITPPQPIVLAPGDIYAVVSDGFFEATNAAGEQFGRQRVVDLLVQHHQLPAKRIGELLEHAVIAFTGGTERTDDQTLLLIKSLD